MTHMWISSAPSSLPRRSGGSRGPATPSWVHLVPLEAAVRSAEVDTQQGMTERIPISHTPPCEPAGQLLTPPEISISEISRSEISARLGYGYVGMFQRAHAPPSFMHTHGQAARKTM